jgi:hypothetical protein
MSAYLKFIGKEKGSIPGIPARDLTEKEAKDIGIAHLLQSGLYVRFEPPYEELKQEPPAAPAAETKEEKPKRIRRRKE